MLLQLWMLTLLVATSNLVDSQHSRLGNWFDPLGLRHRLSRWPVNRPININAAKQSISPTTSDNRKLTAEEASLGELDANCGSVPIYEKVSGKSLNATASNSSLEAGEFRILYGLETEVGEWPWIVMIKRCSNQDDCQVCTGTLLTSRWIISAGHCGFNITNLNTLSATLGLYDLVSPDESSFSLGIDKLVMHPDYADLSNDIALFRLERTVEFTNLVQPACLIPAVRNALAYATGKQCFTVGYGLTVGMLEPLRLQKLRIEPKRPSECNTDRLGAVTLGRGNLCIGPPDGLMGSACKGDSGGPDLCYDAAANRWFLIGTVSFGPSDCDRSHDDKWLSVSVELANYRTWILATLRAE